MISKELLKAIEREENIRKAFENNEDFLNSDKIRLPEQKGILKYVHPVTRQPITFKEYHEIKRHYLKNLRRWLD